MLAGVRDIPSIPALGDRGRWICVSSGLHSKTLSQKEREEREGEREGVRERKREKTGEREMHKMRKTTLRPPTCLTEKLGGLA